MCMIQRYWQWQRWRVMAAVKGHDVLSTREAEELIHRLLVWSTFTCPHGRPTIIELTKYEMEKMFKRIQN